MSYKQIIAASVIAFAGHTLTTEQVVALVAKYNADNNLGLPESKIRANVSPAYYCADSAFGATLFARTGTRGRYNVLSATEREFAPSTRSNGVKRPLLDTAAALYAALEAAKASEAAKSEPEPEPTEQ